MSATPPVPDAFGKLFVDLEEIAVSRADGTFHQCFGCGPEHTSGLRVRCFGADGEVLSPIIVPGRYAGPPGAAHGGIVAAYLDEVLAAAAVHHTGRVHVTGELAVRYVKPTPVERPLLGRARATRNAGRYVELRGTLEDLETRTILARATGRFFPVPDGQ